MTKQELAQAVLTCLQADDPSFYKGTSFEFDSDEELDEHANQNNEFGFCLSAVFEIEKMIKAQGGQLRSRQIIATAVFDAKCRYVMAREFMERYG